MAEDEPVQELFGRIRAFGWHEEKRQSNLRVHKIDFASVKRILDGRTCIRRSDRHDEVRYQIFGYVDGREIAVVCELREDVYWIISARRARRDERRRYIDRFARRPDTERD